MVSLIALIAFLFPNVDNSRCESPGILPPTLRTRSFPQPLKLCLTNGFMYAESSGLIDLLYFLSSNSQFKNNSVSPTL